MMFAYEVKCISDFSNDGTKVDVGVISAPSMSDAAKIIEGYYSDLLISANFIYLHCSSRNMVPLKRVKEHFHLTDTADS